MNKIITQNFPLPFLYPQQENVTLTELTRNPLLPPTLSSLKMNNKIETWFSLFNDQEKGGGFLFAA